ncbi:MULTISPECIES: DegT/DnrJ/EryC1/StrS family aminotransferase [unclassified Microbacterium]|uniref:DegT/DnrJ/EryC1/StrS family aminotransferase n=1 Tax=unclassified Microbacterium TaxID=2609290 RepID=UPI003C2E6F58
MAEWEIGVEAPWLGQAELNAVAEVIASGWVGQGPRVARFEQDFAGLADANYAVATANGTDALHLALLVAGVRPGEDVVVPSLAFIATANAVRSVGATPVFADVDPVTGTATAATVERALTPTTTAVIVADHGGSPVDLQRIRDVTDPLGIVVIEDTAGGVGSTCRGRPVGAAAEIATWSFDGRAILTTGDGGMLTTTHAAWAARARRLREHGMITPSADPRPGSVPPAEEYREVGGDSRLTDLQAAVGIVQLGRLPEIVRRRRQIADRYRDGLRGVRGLRLAADPAWGTGNVGSFWVEVEDAYPVDRDGLLAALAAAGIAVRRGGSAIHRYAPYRALTPPDGLPGSERFADRTLALPVSRTLTAAQQDQIVAILHDPGAPALANAQTVTRSGR